MVIEFIKFRSVSNCRKPGLELPKAAEQTQEAEQEQSAAPVMAVAEGKAVEPEKAPKTASKRRPAKYKVNVKAPKKDKAASMGR